MKRVALVDDGDGLAHVLAEGLRAAGRAATVVDARPVAPAEQLFARRGFTGPLSHLPVLLGRLVAGDYALVHSFGAGEALAARGWRRITGGAVVFTCRETLDRRAVADRRLRRQLLTGAIEGSDVLLAASEPVRAGLVRWFAVAPEVVDPVDADATLDAYDRLAPRRGA